MPFIHRSKVPKALVMQEPDSFSLTCHTETKDSGIALFVSDSTAEFKNEKLSVVGLLLTPNQTLSLLNALRKVEVDMKSEVAEGRGGREAKDWEFVRKNIPPEWIKE